MSQKRIFLVLLGLWALVFGWSFVALAFTAPTDFGFTRGMNRIEVFAKWQFLAGVLAIVLAATGRHTLGRIVWLPLSVFVLEICAVLGLILWANLSKPAPTSAPPTGPVTVPAAPVAPD